MRQGLRVARAELEGCPLMLPSALSQPFWQLAEHLWCLKLGERGWGEGDRFCPLGAHRLGETAPKRETSLHGLWAHGEVGHATKTRG